MSLLLFCFLSVGVASPAFASANERYKEQAAQFEKMLDKQAGAPGADAAAKDIERTRQWLENANVLLAKGNEEAAAKYLRRVKFSLDLITALVQAGNIQKAADDQEEAFYKAKEKQIPELEADVQKLKDKKKELQQELSKLR
ncbi:hypothetical protein FIV42_28720 [Persicimonas caeni]|jgi:hypothetical protein|uniref:DUF4398 domain-containing protein n=1 Tax=Persicimonas caeni TaxID=2292766 RepID=A0A4Y6Q3L4_PERCE|nr:hypothetical protein [Persicimonas caeni]QDG54585.1 hypothetical protein FIV42_28720 [Persicimonas caeni]QED35806.1 hypothetical protein FRD00_28715 [Persicimonas caeni]